MTALLIVIVVALLGVTVWQISKIFKLSKPVGESDTPIANNKDNEKQGQLMLVFMVLFYAFMFYCFYEYSRFYLPESASEHGYDYDQLMFITLGVIMTVQLFTQALVYYFSYKYRGKEGRRALFYADNDKLEFIWTIIPVVVLAGLIIYGLFSWSEVMNPIQKEDTRVVEIYGYQFDWKARYSGEDNTLGKANVRLIEGVNQLGVDENDPYAQDDVITRELHLPVDEPVLFKFRSQDVLHSAFFPFFRAQMNVVPGMVTQFSFTPTKTTEEMRESDYMVDKVNRVNNIRDERNKELAAEGKTQLDNYEFDYYLMCNKICGVSHYNMQMKIVVESKEDFKKWMKKQQEFKEVIAQNN
jgi:cytochrome c oxidase subunit 2